MSLPPAWTSEAKAIAVSGPAHLQGPLEGQGLRECVYPGLLAQRRFFPPLWVALAASLGLVNPDSVGKEA